MKMVPLGELISPAGFKAGNDSDHPVYSVTKHSGFVPSTEYFKKQIFSRDLAGYKRVRPGDFAYATIHLDEGSIGIAPSEGLISPMYTVFRPNTTAVIPEYLLRFMKSPMALAQYPRFGKGSVHRRKSISFDALCQLMVPLPPPDEQRRIAMVLDHADALRTIRTRVLAEFASLQTSVFRSMFGNPVTNEHKWKRMIFGEVCETRLGKMLDSKQQTGRDARPYLRNANVQWFRFDLSNVYSMDIDPASREVLRLEHGDVLICEGGQPGRAAVWRGQSNEMYFQKALHRARPNPALATPDFIAHLMFNLVTLGGLKDYVTAATIGHLTGAKLKQLPIIVPDLELQQRFTAQLAVIDAASRRAQAGAAADAQLFASLQSRAFAGNSDAFCCDRL